MLRSLVFLLIVVVVALMIAIASGFLNINQIRGAQAPQLSATRNGVSAKGGQAPAFDVETGSLKVGAKQQTVRVPALVVQKPAHNQAAATNNQQ
jgi:hypothetical protein